MINLFRLPADQEPAPRYIVVQDGKRKRAPLSKLKVGGVIDRELEGVCHVQCCASGVDVPLVICGDIQERQINKSRTGKLCV